MLRTMIDRLLDTSLWMILAAMAVIVSANVFCRFLLGFSIYWGDEVAQVLLVWLTFLGAAVGMAVIIFVGILGGIFTATEASAVAVMYAAAVGLIIYRQLRIVELPEILIVAAKTTASLSFLIACASLFSWTLSMGKVPEVMTAGLMNVADTIIAPVADSLSPDMADSLRRIVVLMVLNVSLLLVGMFIDAGPGLLIVVPVVLPISKAIGMDSGLDAVHFGVLVVTNMVIGLVTPPVGSTLFVASAIGRATIPQMVPHLLRFLAVMLVVQLLITFVPAITTALPSLMN
jgi:tripartite ATP-independent transporter DctM subunit